MKKYVFIFLGMLCLATTSPVFAQTNRFTIGAEGGVGFSHYYGESVPENFYKPDVSFGGGVYFQYNLKKILSFRTGILSERKGAYVYGVFLGGDPEPQVGEVHIQLNYVTMPFLVRATFGNRFQFFVNGGGFVGVLANATSASGPRSGPFSSSDITQNFRRFDAGVSVGLGINYHINDKFLVSAEVRDNLSLYSQVSNGRVFNNNAILWLGFGYKLGARS